jgi:2-oxoglutarate ferredoxin oxidoreductase subunit beta
VTYNKINTYPWFKQRVYKLEDEKGYNTSDFQAALRKSFEWDPKIPLGVFYQGDELTYEDSEPALKQGPLVRQPLGMEKGLFEELVEEFY